MKRVFAVLLLLLLGACGKPPVIVQPADGQAYALGSFTCFDVLLENNVYDNTTIAFYGAEQFAGMLQCQNASNGPARCCQAYNQGGAGFGGQACTQDRPCTIFIVATKGDYQSFHSVKIYTGGAVTPTPPR